VPRELRAALFGLAAALAVAPLRGEDEPAPRWRAPIEIRRPAPFVQLALPIAAYGHSEAPDLADLRVVDALDTRMPFALLAPRAESRRDEQHRPATLYPLPPRPAADGRWPLPVDITVDGNHVHVRRDAAGIAQGAGARSGGWVVDLGERADAPPAPRWLRLHWTGTAEFSAGYRLEASDDLRAWRSAGAGQLLALVSAGGPLRQPDVALPAPPARFLRLVWNDPTSAPPVDGAEAIVDARRQVALDAPTELTLSGVRPTPDGREPAPPAGALVVDLGAALALVSVELRFASGTHVAPVRVQARERADEAWRELGAAVFYRVERGGDTIRGPALDVQGRARWLRLVPDPRAGALDPGTSALAVQVQLARIVFPLQGEPPYAVRIGAPGATAAALPAATLVPSLETERAHFGEAVLGAWQEDLAAARRQEAARRDAQWRPRLLWAVLVAGVLALAVMVWRLARAPARSASVPDAAPPA
jgi:hypothetical protein